MRRIALATTLLAFAVPATAAAADYYDGASNGARVITSGHTIQKLEVYCPGSGYYDREFEFSIAHVARIKHGGSFSYSGLAYRYGPERQPRGHFRVKLSGRVGSGAARVSWKTLPGCSRGRVSAARAG